MKPERVRKAQIEGDTNYLREAGKKGAEVANDNRKLRAEHDALWKEIEAEKALVEEHTRALEANEYIVPIDAPEDAE